MSSPNLDSRPDTDYFGDGLTGELIYNLSRVEGLEVKSRASSSMLKGASISAHDAGVRLGADLILEGDVQRRVGIEVQPVERIQIGNAQGGQ